MLQTQMHLYGGHAGAQFLLAVKIFETSKKCLPIAKRPSSLSYSAINWALHSDSQDGLLPLVMPQNVRPFARVMHWLHCYM